MKLLALFALIAFAYADESSTRIMGGSSASIEQYPFIANVQLLHDEVWWYHVTGGTLLTRVIVLTAGRFIGNNPSRLWRVRLGSALASSGGSLHPVSEITLHPEFDQFYNDLAILRLSVPAVYSDTIQRASIAGPNYILPEGTVVQAAGWGSNMLARPTSEILRGVDVDIINQEYCVERYDTLPNWPNVTDRMFCAGINGKGFCGGDAGGPVVHNRNVLVGVIAFSYGCGQPEYPGVHTKVSYYASWIASFS